MRGYWLRPQYVNTPDGGYLTAGPVQINWYNHGLRVHLTWPAQRTLSIRERGGR